MAIRILILLLLSTVAPAAVAQITILHAGAGCGRTIQQALDAGVAAGAATIFVKVVDDASHTAQAIVLPAREVILEGGFASCTDPESDPDRTSTINGAGGTSAPVISAPPCGASCDPSISLQLQLRNLVIRGGEQGGLRVRRARFITVQRTSFSNNATPGSGGGIEIGPDPANPAFTPSINLIDNSIVGDNTAAVNGGGIACSDAVVTVNVETLVADNVAQGNGGGLHAGAGCRMSVHSSGVFRGVIRNRAQSGGGVYADEGSDVVIGANAFSPGPQPGVLFFRNVAVGLPGVTTLGGGAIAGRNSDLTVTHALISENQAQNRPLAAAIAYETSGATLPTAGLALRGTARSVAGCKVDRTACIRVFGNFTTLPDLPAPLQTCSAIGVRSDRDVEIDGVEVQGNFINTVQPSDVDATSAAVCLRSLGATRPALQLRRSLVVQNSNTAHAVSFSHATGSAAEAGSGLVDFTTTAENGLAGAALASVRSFVGPLDIRNSILMDAGATPFVGAAGASTVAGRLIALAYPGTPPADSVVQTASATFVNAPGGDFSLNLSPSNIALDSAPCAFSTQTDYENELWFDLPNLANLGGACDRGADEFTDRLLLDGFEP